MVASKNGPKPGPWPGSVTLPGKRKPPKVQKWPGKPSQNRLPRSAKKGK